VEGERPPVRHAIVGTAGHVDHGKTRLVEALTGVDCDRWAEEKSRGITLDLGFANLGAEGLELGFIDVPGHERFLHNALAGLGGIRILLLVVAADEGVQPQTREHLEICSLLDIPAALVALTKADLVGEETLGLARLEIEELLAATPFAGAAILPVSSTTGQGVEELKAHLVDLAGRYPAELDPERPARLPIDRAFQLKGLGTVVTGTLVQGVVREGSELELVPGGRRLRVRSVQVHGSRRAEACRGERTALQIAGAEVSELRRGLQLIAPGAYRPTTSAIATFHLSPTAAKPIRGSTPIRLHLYAEEVSGRLRPLAGAIEPGASGPVEIRLQGPVAAVRGDRFIVRRPSPPTTLGGGTILDPQSERRRGERLRRALAALTGDEAGVLALWAAERGESGLEADAVAHRLGRTPESAAGKLDRLVAESKLLALPTRRGTRYLAPRVYRQVAERAAELLARYHQADRRSPGMPKAELVQRLLPASAAPHADAYLDWLAAQKILLVTGDLVRRPGEEGGLDDRESALARALTELYRAAGLEPPSPAALAIQLGAKTPILEGVVRYLIERGRLIKLPGDLVISPDAISGVERELRATGWQRFTVPQFKERFGLTRKWAIPILEHLDSTGITQRVGNERWIRPPVKKD
jgi:selenocysteine-specific elongation factor